MAMAWIAEAEAACGRTNWSAETSPSYIVILNIPVENMDDTQEIKEMVSVVAPFVDFRTIGARALGAAVTLRRYRPSARLTKEEGDWLAAPATPRWVLLHGAYKDIVNARFLVVVATVLAGLATPAIAMDRT
jgi:hypothetical protein